MFGSNCDFLFKQTPFFKIGFKIRREKLDEYIRQNTMFYSLFLSDLHTCVNIKMKSKQHSQDQLDFVVMKSKDNFEINKIPFSSYSQHYDYNKKLREYNLNSTYESIKKGSAKERKEKVRFNLVTTTPSIPNSTSPIIPVLVFLSISSLVYYFYNSKR